MHLCISSMEEGIYGALTRIKLLIKLLVTSMQYIQRRQVLILVMVPGQCQQLVSLCGDFIHMADISATRKEWQTTVQ